MYAGWFGKVTTFAGVAKGGAVAFMDTTLLRISIPQVARPNQAAVGGYFEVVFAADRGGARERSSHEEQECRYVMIFKLVIGTWILKFDGCKAQGKMTCTRSKSFAGHAELSPG